MNIGAKSNSTALVSIIIPVYNSEEYLSECVNSVIQQAYRNIQIILVDDGSTDTSLNICQQYARDDERVTVVSQKNSGVSSARNMGLSMATGEYVTFVDSDDWVELDAIHNMVNIISKNMCDFVKTTHYTSGKKQELGVSVGTYTQDNMKQLVQALLVGSVQCYVVLILARRDAIMNKKPFREELNFLEDKCFYFEVLSASNSLYISNIATYHYRSNSNSTTKSSSNYESNIEQTIQAHRIISANLQKQNYSCYIITAKISHLHTILGILYLIYKDGGGERLNSTIRRLSRDSGYNELCRFNYKLFDKLDTHYTWLLGRAIMRERSLILHAVFKLRSLYERIICTEKSNIKREVS